MTYNSHTWELIFDDTPLMLDGTYVGRFSGSASMARDVCETITLDTEDGKHLAITPSHTLFRPLWAGIRYSYPNALRIANWREEVAA